MKKILVLLMVIFVITLVGCKKEIEQQPEKEAQVECCAMQADFDDAGEIPFIVCDTDSQGKQLTNLEGVDYLSFYNKSYYQCVCVEHKLEEITFEIPSGNYTKSPLLNIFQGC